ncbi:MAG TPA: hypothetical protein [Caudoviricetes sp.]|nr:MAG TPA: hypothetical protein [Caudoviricetes sp.]
MLLSLFDYIIPQKFFYGKPGEEVLSISFNMSSII